MILGWWSLPIPPGCLIPSCRCRLQILRDKPWVREWNTLPAWTQGPRPSPPCLLPGPMSSSQVKSHTLRKWWEITSALLPCPQSIKMMDTKATFLSLAHGRVAARAHAAREKAQGGGGGDSPGKLWTAVICLENISPQSAVRKTWAGTRFLFQLQK